MATQWTAGLSALTPLPAATLNRIGAAWESWTPTVTAKTGTFTTVTVNEAKYAQIQKIIIARAKITVNSIGTAAGMRFTLPFAATATGVLVAYWRESSVGGLTGVGETFPNASTCDMSRYDNAAYLVNLGVYIISIAYEAA